MLTPLKIQLKNFTCAICGNKPAESVVAFRNHDGEIYCSACGYRQRKEAVCDKYDVVGTEGKLRVERVVLEKIFKNVFSLTNLSGSLFVFEEEKPAKMSADDFLAEKNGKYFILEKIMSRTVLLFPDSIIRSEEDFLKNHKEYGGILAWFTMEVGWKNPYLLLDRRGRILGISDATLRELRSADFQCCNRLHNYMTHSELEGECMEKDYPGTIRRALRHFDKRELLEYCQSRIQGQGTQLKIAVYLIYRYLQAAASGKNFTAQSWILTAPSGSGKTEFFRALRDFFAEHKIPVPVVQIDLSKITEEGYKGENSSVIPKKILSECTASKGVGICFLDEADKKCIPSYGSHGTDFNAAVQANLLTLVEGTRLKVDVERKADVEFDSEKTMFIFTGAFQSMRHLKAAEAAEEKKKLGFSVERSGSNTQRDIYADLTIQDIIDFGMQEELAGRLSRVINFRKLSEEAMLGVIRSKSEEISRELCIKIRLTPEAEEELLKISFGGMGIRRPMNIIRELVQNTAAEIFFEGEWDEENDVVVITSADTACVEKKEVRTLGG